MRENKKTAIRRYIKDIELHLLEEEVVDEIRSFLDENYFYQTIWRQEYCFCADHWSADDGLGKNLKKLFFFKYEYQAGFLHIEAWIREGKNSESSLFGGGASDLKKPYLTQILSLQEKLIEKLPKSSSWYKREKESLQKSMKTHCDSVKLYQFVVGTSILILLVLMYLFA